MTRKACYEKLLTMEAVQADPEIVETLNKELVALGKRTDRERKLREAKHPEGDVLKGVVLKAIPHDWATIDVILGNINDASVTRQKAVHRIGVLIKEGLVQKMVDKTDDKVVTFYSLV